ARAIACAAMETAPIMMDHGAAPDGADRLPFEAPARIVARSLYWRYWTVQQIADELRLPYTTVSSWKSRDAWDLASPLARAENETLARYLALVWKEKKSGSDFKEIDLLGRQMERQARI